MVEFVMETPNLGTSDAKKRKRATKSVGIGAVGSSTARRHSAIEVGAKRKRDDDTEGSNKAARRASEPSLAAGAVEVIGDVPSEAASPSTAQNYALEEVKKPTTGFRINRPIKADVNIDVWRTIFEHSVPRVLLNARMVCNAFKEELHDTSRLWTLARKNAYGEDTVPCPEELKEREFCNLIEGFGCQNHGCRKFELTTVGYTEMLTYI